MTSGRNRLDQIVRGLDGVTAGEWHTGCLGGDGKCQCSYILSETYMGAIASVHVGNGLPIGEGGNDAPPAEEAAANMRHIARCSPDAIREIAAYVRDLEERLAKAAEALEPFNQAALAIRTAERMNRREFQDGDTFVSGVAWKEDDKVRTITFGDFRRARTALTTIRRTEK